MAPYSCFIMLEFTHLNYGTILEESRHCVSNCLVMQLKRVSIYEPALEIYGVRDGVRISAIGSQQLIESHKITRNNKLVMGTNEHYCEQYKEACIEYTLITRTELNNTVKMYVFASIIYFSVSFFLKLFL